MADNGSTRAAESTSRPGPVDRAPQRAASRCSGPGVELGGRRGVQAGRPSSEGQDILDALYTGLHVLAENLGALTLPFPPPVVPAPRGRHLRVVK